MSQLNNPLLNESIPREARKFTGVDLRTLKSHQAEFVEHSPKRILFIGGHGRQFCENMIDLNYVGFSLESAAKALPWLEEQSSVPSQLPHAIICDLRLPDGDAFSLFESIKKNANLKLIPFIAISEEENSSDKAKALKTGFDDFYSLSFKAEDIHNRIRFLQQFKREKARVEAVNDTVFAGGIPLSKRLFDIFFSATALLMLTPLFLVIAALVKFGSKGPVFYASKRVGTNYKIFDFYKFRSMRVGADAELQKLMHLNQYGAGNGSFVKISNDPRITKIGHFIRNTSIDELPQLFNVLIGDMSIVGNRPLPLYEAEQLTIDRWSKRFLAPAGITGLWQVTKRGKKDMSESERMELDILYAKTYSLWLDIQIILRTFPALLQKEKV